MLSLLVTPASTVLWWPSPCLCCLPQHCGHRLGPRCSLCPGPGLPLYCCRSRRQKPDLCSGHLCSVLCDSPRCPLWLSAARSACLVSPFGVCRPVRRSPVAFPRLTPTTQALSSWTPARQSGFSPHIPSLCGAICASPLWGCPLPLSG